MQTTIPPAHKKAAASLDWETATVGDLWRLSGATGIPASTILRALDKLEGPDSEGRSKIGKH